MEQKRYEPELGQAVFGQPYKEYEAPHYVEAALTLISEELERVGHNVLQENFVNPFSNTGASFTVIPKMLVHAYSWNDEEQPFNFKWRDLEISWYKYLGRGMSMNRQTTPQEIAEMIDDCFEAMCSFEKEHCPDLY